MREAGIESVVEAALGAYLQETPRRMEALESAVAARDMEAVEREAHGMKSGSRNLRAHQLAILLEAMENAGREGREADVHATFPRVKSEFQAVMAFLDTGQGGGSGGDGEVPDGERSAEPEA